MKAITLNISPDATRAIKRISAEDPEGSWERAPYEVKKALYDEFGPEDVAEMISEEKVAKFQLEMYERGELTMRELAKIATDNPREIGRQILQ